MSYGIEKLSFEAIRLRDLNTKIDTLLAFWESL